MTTDIVLHVEASLGVKVKVGDKVKEGEKLGMSPNMGGPLVSPVAGTVSNISFNSEEHTFVIRIKRIKRSFGFRFKKWIKEKVRQMMDSGHTEIIYFIR
ncbi:hypothetical protein LR013_03185 [candidate division NPL-UPA2 bacterium]|nr:hypothetical protein [candidate division NPL-UPA2 bacterium]